MSDNPLIESFLKLQERLVAIPAKRATVPATPITDANRDTGNTSSSMTSSPTNLNTGSSTKTIPYQGSEGQKMAQVGAPELQRPEVRRALGKEENQSAGFLTGLKDAADKAVADRREKEAAEKAGDLQTQRMAGREAEAEPEKTPPMAMNPRGYGAGYAFNSGTPERIEPAVNKTQSEPIVTVPDRDRTASDTEDVGTRLSNLSVGASGEEVKRAQEALGINADGQFGPQTKQAVMDFQRKHGLKVDGIIGDQTLSMMNRLKDLGEETDLKEAGGIGGGISGTKFSKGAENAPAVGAGVRSAVNNFTMGGSKYARAGADYLAKTVMGKPTNFSNEVNQEVEKDAKAQAEHPVATTVGDTAATVAQVLSGVGAGKALATTSAKAIAKTAAERAAAEATEKAASKVARDRAMLMSNSELNNALKASKSPELVRELERRKALESMPNLPVPKPLQLTPQMRAEENNEVSKGNDVMSENPFIKGFFDIEEARAKKTNIFDESKKLTAKQKKHLDKNNNDKIDAEDFEMLRKEEIELDEASKEHLERLKKMLDKAKPGSADHSQIRHAISSMYGDEHIPAKHKNVKPDMYEEIELDEADTVQDLVIKAINSKLKKAKVSYRDPNAKNAREEDRIAKMLAAKAKKMKEEVEFSEEEINFIQSVMEAMPVAPTSEADSPNPTPKKKAEGSRAKGSMAD